MAGNHGEAEKGSQYQIQRYVNEEPEVLNTMILESSPSLMAFGTRVDSIKWKSPLKVDLHGKEEYHEYRDDFLEIFELERYKNQLREFWPQNGPQWDGLAIIESENGEGYLLVEAKAHSKETINNIGAGNKDSVEKIKKAFADTQEYMKTKDSDWTKNHYQLANRLAFLYFMNIKLKLDTWLVLINFVEDETHIKTEEKEWLSTYSEIFRKMGITQDSPIIERIITVFPEAKKKQ